MNSDFKIFALKNNYDSAIIGILGALLIFLFTRHGGIGLEPDSIVYLSTARSAALGGGFFEFEGIPLTDFPLGYPAFLGIILFITQIDILQSAPIINMLLFFVLIYLSGCIINEFTRKNHWIKVPFLILIVFSPILLNAYTTLMSETLFLVMILVFFVVLKRYGREKTINTLILVAVIAGLSCVVRYAGITLIGAAGLMILFDRKLKVKEKIGHVLLFGAISVLFLAANLLRNFLIIDTLTGPRESSITSLFENIKNYTLVLSDFFKYTYLPYELVLLIGIALFTFYVFTFVFHVAKSEKFYNYLSISVSYFIVYSVFIIFSATLSRFDKLDMRLLSPLFLPCLFPLAFGVEWLTSKLNGWKKYSFISICVLIFSTTIFYQYKDNRDLYEMAKNSGIPGYAEDVWRDSKILNYIRNNKQKFTEQTKIYSDGNEAVWLFTGLKSDLIPHNEYESEITEFIDNQKIDYYIVWFYDNIDPELLSLEKLLKEYKLKLVMSSSEGLLYYHQASTDSQNLN
jgi:hypothetical protein